jgi:adenosine deaminase
MTHILPGTDISIESLPKVSLHDHLDGGLRPQTIIDLAPEHELELPATDAGELAEWFAQQSDSGSLVEYLKTFDITTGVMQTAGALQRIAREFVEDLHADGVICGEIRWAPEQHLQRGLSLDDAVDAVQAGIDEAVSSIRAAGGQMWVGQLISAMRQADNGLEIAKLALRHRDNGAAGFDIAGPEAGFPPARMREAFDLLATELFPVTVHAGEADGIESIRSALFDGRALRLGHGVRIVEDMDISHEGDTMRIELGQVAQWVLDRGIPLETSPSSNLQTGAVGQNQHMADHPFDLLYRLGFVVTVNTDNRLMSHTTLSKELALLAETFDYDIDDLMAFQINAAHAAFVNRDDKDTIIDAIIDGFEAA